MSRDLTGFPMVTLHFAGRADLGLDAESLFHDNGPGELWMALSPSSSDLKELSVTGVMAQQSYNIGYDIGGKKIFFQRIDWELLE